MKDHFLFSNRAQFWKKLPFHKMSYLGADSGLAIKEAVKRDAVPLVGAVELLDCRLEISNNPNLIELNWTILCVKINIDRKI